LGVSSTVRVPLFDHLLCSVA